MFKNGDKQKKKRSITVNNGHKFKKKNGHNGKKKIKKNGQKGSKVSQTVKEEKKV